MEENGIVLINKKEGLSTTKEEYPLKKIFNTKKVGHLGTLDPFASGLIICGINKGTKLFPLLEDLDKTYIACLQLGKKTSSLDLSGELLETKTPSYHSLEEINSVLNSFLGEITQVPPMYSAIKVNGVPLYKLAREKIEIERKVRKVNIKSIKLISYENDQITFIAKVSKGTYIRTLGEDIALKLNELGHLIKLTRTKIGDFHLNYAKEIEHITTNDLIPIDKVLNNVDKYQIEDYNLKAALNGNKLKLNSQKDMLLIMHVDKIIALYYYDTINNVYKPRQMF